MLKRMLRLQRHFRKSALVLMYHRIADAQLDPWELAVSASNFEQHLKALKNSGMVVPLSEVVQQLQNRQFKKKCIAITFDDGYVDNYQTAKPLLEQYGLPATFFITSRNIGVQKEFWWDELEHILLHTEKLPQEFSMNGPEASFHFNLGSETVLTNELRQKQIGFVAYEPVTLRTRLYFELWKMLTPLNMQEQESLMQTIRAWAGQEETVRPAYSCMSTQDIAALSSHHLFTIGGHTATHLALAYHSREVQYQEILSNKQFLEKITGKPLDLFAYPSGNYNEASIEVLKETGFSAAFTTHPQPVLKGADRYKINRFQVNNWSGLEFQHKLNRWFLL